jgi:hypothetical protein
MTSGEPFVPHPFANVKDYGARGDGLTNDTAAFDVATGEAVRHGLPLFIPVGDYLVDPLEPIRSPLRIIGAGGHYGIGGTQAARLLLTSGSGTLLRTEAHLEIESVVLMGTRPPRETTTSRGLLLGGGAYSRISRCLFAGFNRHVENHGSVATTLDHNTFVNAKEFSTFWDHPGTQDAGDHVLVGNLFDTDAREGWAAKAAVRHLSSTGAKLVANKFFHHVVQIDVAPKDGVANTVMVIVGNSFEQSDGGAQIRFARSGTDGTFQVATVVGNEFTPMAGGGIAESSIEVGDGSGAIHISGNVFHASGAAAGRSAIRGVGGSAGVSVGGNQFSGWPVAVDFSQAAYCDVQVGENFYFGGVVPSNPPSVASRQVRPADATAVPDVTGMAVVDFGRYTSAAVVTNFVGGVAGQIITLIGSPEVTIANNAAIKTASGRATSLAANRAYQFVFTGSAWIQVAG